MKLKRIIAVLLAMTMPLTVTNAALATNDIVDFPIKAADDDYTIIKAEGGNIYVGFYNNIVDADEGITSATIPSYVERVDSGSFSKCKKLESLTIEGRKYIYNDAFKNCTNLKKVIVNGSVNNSALQNLNLKSLGPIGSGCDLEYRLDYLENIGGFSDFKNLETVQLASSIKRVESSAFEGCSHLNTIIIPDGLIDIGSSAFRDCVNLYNITLPEGLIAIQGSAFNNCKSLKKIKIPSSVTYIGDYAFSDCDNLKTAGIVGGGYDVEFDWGDYIEANAFSGMNYLTEINIPSSVKTIKSSAFKNCTALNSLTIPNTVTDIEEYAFNGCTSLTDIKLSNNLTLLSECLFANCSGLKSIDIPSNIANIASGVFANCTSLTGINLSDNITSIGDNAFYNCKGLVSIRLPKNLTDINNNTFSECENLQIVELPDNLKNIGDSAFSKCTSLNYITIPSKVTSLGKNCFENSGLRHIKLPDSVTALGEECFYNCKNLGSVTLSKNIEVLESGLFSSNNSLNELVIPEGVKTIKEYVFASSYLNYVVVPKSVTTIEGFVLSNAKLIYCEKGSYVEEYAISNNYPYKYLDEAPNKPNIAYGDVDNNKKIEIEDMKILRSKILNDDEKMPIEYLTDDYLTIADVDGDGLLTATDMVMIRQKAFKGNYKFPVER